MPEPHMPGRVTSRRGLRGSSGSPGTEGGMASRSPRTLHSRRPTGHTKAGHEEDSADEFSDENENIEGAVDEVDRSNCPRSSPGGLYPDLEKNFRCSPTQKPPAKFGSPNDSFDSTKTSCISRTGPRVTQKVPKTPEKGSPGKRLYPDLAEENPNQKTRGASPVIVIFIFTMIIIGALLLHKKFNEAEVNLKPRAQKKAITEVYEDLKTLLRVLNHDLSQPKQFWIQLVGQLGLMMVKDPRQPAVILVVVPQDSRATAVCLVHKMASTIKEAFEDRKFVMYDVASGDWDDAQSLKVELDSALGELEMVHAAVVHNIEKVPGNAAMIFHAYCDNENAPHKQVVIFAVMEVPGYYETIANTRLDELVTWKLSNLWGAELLEKDVSAIISRIANAPILVKPESKATIKTLCGDSGVV